MSNYGQSLTQEFDKILKKNYGTTIVPPPTITPFGIRPLDAILGGGLGSNMPVQFSSTPESG